VQRLEHKTKLFERGFLSSFALFAGIVALVTGFDLPASEGRCWGACGENAKSYGGGFRD